jgi:hypothetical protein
MIMPHPESDMKLNVMVLGSEVIKILKTRGKGDKYVLVENILTDFLKGDERRTPDLFMVSLLFLFSIGLIDQRGYKIKLTPQIAKQIKLFD